MDQIKIGRFIAKMRKEKPYTQRQLADMLGISDKTVSKWETGNGLPDVSLMMPLCDLLQISVNELLSGERLTDSEYQKKAEENMMNLIMEREESKKKIFKLEQKNQKLNSDKKDFTCNGKRRFRNTKNKIRK